MHRPLLAVALIALALPCSTAGAQTLAEFGMDAALTHSLDSPSSTVLILPVSRVRLGIFTLPNLEIEPSLELVASNNNNGSATSVVAGIAALYHFNTSRTEAQPYVRPFLDITSTSTSFNSVSASGSSTEFGVGLGVKVPWLDRIAWRFEGAYASRSGHGAIMALGGLSFFTH